MAKRAPQEELEKEGGAKKIKDNNNEFLVGEKCRLAPDQAVLIERAVEAALQPELLQPIVLDLWDEDIQDSQAYAYVPRSRAVGEWYCKTLLVLLHPDFPNGLHSHMRLTGIATGYVDPDEGESLEHLCKKLGQPGITDRAALGDFHTLCLPGDSFYVPPQLERTALHFALYHQKAYVSGVSTIGSLSSDNSDDDEEEESNSATQ